MTARLIALDTKIFGGETIIQPAFVCAISFSFDQGGGAYLDVTLSSSHVIHSNRIDAADSGTVAKLKAYRDTLVDRINAANIEDQPPAPSTSEPEKVKL